MKIENSRIDLFRYSIISPLVYGEFSNVRDFCETASKKKYYYKGKEYYFSSDTIRKWYYKYKNNGFDSLTNNLRKDKKTSRKLNEEIINYIIDLKSKYPRITTKNIYNKIMRDGYIDASINVNAFYRYIRSNNLRMKVITSVERRRFEKPYPNDTWQGDTSYGPYILVDGKKYRTYIIHFIDDNSRLVVGAGIYFHDNAENVEKVLKQAISKYGIPKQLYLDNGKSYKNNQLEIICARLGIKVTHTHAYDPEAKGKVERCFRTIKEGWMYSTDWNQFKTIEELEENYKKYLYNNYINKKHSELDDTPNNVWHKGIENTLFKQISEEKLEEAFMHTITRQVQKDRTITIDNVRFEVPYKYIYQTIELRYYINDKMKLWIYSDGERKEECKLLNKKENSLAKRKNNIDFTKIVNNEEDVEEMKE